MQHYDPTNYFSRIDGYLPSNKAGIVFSLAISLQYAASFIFLSLIVGGKVPQHASAEDLITNVRLSIDGLTSHYERSQTSAFQLLAFSWHHGVYRPDHFLALRGAVFSSISLSRLVSANCTGTIAVCYAGPCPLQVAVARPEPTACTTRRVS